MDTLRDTTMIESANTYAVVVWYYPTPDQRDAIRSYMSAVAHVIIVDNSPADNTSLAAALPQDRCTYLPLHDNAGVATALNIACRKAIEMGAQWIMTMDQDSRWQADQLSRYIELANAYPDLDRVGVFSPRQDYSGHTRQYADTYEQKIAVMTSGCLISVAGFNATEGFRDELFIDEVDNEYCMHCRRLGMQVVIINPVRLEHRLGEMQVIRFMGIWRKEYIHHAPFRFYYMTRNNLALSRLYPEYRHFNRKRLKRMLKRVVLYNRLTKIQSLRMCLRGWRDYRAARMGRMQ